MKEKLPNILLIYPDQHSARALGCCGNQDVISPNIDRLAAEGVMFTNAYTQNPICTPSRICMMSGQYTHNTGYYGLMGPNPEHLPSICSYLKQFGYTTGMSGKTHTPTGWLSKDCDHVNDGYGYEIPINEGNALDEEGLQGLRKNAYAQYLRDKGLEEDRDDKILQEWFEKHEHCAGQGVDARPSRLPEDDTIEAWTAAKTIKHIEHAHREGNPFFHWMTPPRPHQVYAPAQKFWDLYDEETLTLPPNAEDEMEGRHPSAQKTQDMFQQTKDWRIFQPDDWESVRRRVLHGYYACVSQVDDAVGRVLKKLDELGIRENTIVIYMSDHGEFAGEHGMIEKAPGIAFRCVTRIPFIWLWPGHLPENTMRDSLVESVDVLPTLCELIGIPHPNWVDGKNITTILNEGGEVRDIAVTENPITKTVHTKRYKFTQYLPEMCDGKDFGELYDLEIDPWELKNVYFEPEYQAVVHELRYKLYCWLVRTQRHITVNPTAPDPAWIDHWRRNWDLAKDLYDDDGKLGFSFIKKMIEHDWMNYL